MEEEQKLSLTDLTVTFVRVIKRNFILLFSVVSIFIILGVLYSFYRASEYKTHFTAYSSILKNEHPTHIFDALNSYLKEGQYERLATFLDLDIETAQKIRKIEAFKTQGITEKDRIPLGMPRFEVNLFTVEITTSAPIDFNAFQTGCSHYLLTSSFVGMKIKNQIKRINREIGVVDSQLALIEAAQKELILSMRKGREDGKTNLNVIGSDIAFPKGTLELIQYRDNLLQSLETSVPMIVVQDIIETKKPSRGKAEVWLISLIAGLILGLLAVFFREILKKI